MYVGTDHGISKLRRMDKVSRVPMVLVMSLVVLMIMDMIHGHGFMMRVETMMKGDRCIVGRKVVVMRYDRMQYQQQISWE